MDFAWLILHIKDKKIHIYTAFLPWNLKHLTGRQNVLSLFRKEQNLSRNAMIQSNFVQQVRGETMTSGQSWPELYAIPHFY